MSHFFDGLPKDEPSRITGFAANTIDRRSEQRSADAVAEALADPAARLYLFRGEEALVKAGQGEQARARYEALFDQVGQGLAELGVTNLHLTGQAGLPRDVPLALQWLERTAQKSPPFYFHLGDILYRGRPGLAASPDAAARAWSRGVRRGCGRCATSLLDFWLGRRQGVTIGDADAFVYAVWAADVGSLQGLADLEKVVTTLAADGPRQLPAAVALVQVLERVEERLADALHVLVIREHQWQFLPEHQHA